MCNYTNFDQVLDELQSLNQTTESIKQKTVSSTQVTYDSQDARLVALEGIQCDIGACGNWIRCLTSLQCSTKERFGDYWCQEYRNLLGTGLCSILAEDLMLDYLRNTLTTKIHFKIENLFRNILKTLSVSYRRGFWHISDAMLQQAGISTTGQEKKTLTVLANLRNSYHSNGMHNNDDLSIDLDGITFEFRKGKSVKCNSWQHIVVTIRANISVLESILFSSKVCRLRNEIPDDFATAGNP